MRSSKKNIYVLDGSSYVHRAYHAIKSLSNSKGLPTNAIFGFTRMLLKLLEEKTPEYMAVALDVPGPTFRHEIYDDYKATRPPMPEDMAVQIPYIREIVSRLNLKILEKKGYEADDIIGTIARLGSAHGFGVVIVSGDKDFKQILSVSTVMWDSMNVKLFDSATIKRDYGLEPAQLIEVMALSGDKADNIPGIPGVGEKTAVSLIKQFHSIEKLFENTDVIPKTALRQKLRQNREQAFLSKELVTIADTLALDITIDDLKTALPQKERLAEIFRELEFKSLTDKFSEHTKLSEKDYRLILTPEDLNSLMTTLRQKGLFASTQKPPARVPLRRNW